MVGGKWRKRDVKGCEGVWGKGLDGVGRMVNKGGMGRALRGSFYGKGGQRALEISLKTDRRGGDTSKNC